MSWPLAHFVRKHRNDELRAPPSTGGLHAQRFNSSGEAANKNTRARRQQRRVRPASSAAPPESSRLAASSYIGRDAASRGPNLGAGVLDVSARVELPRSLETGRKSTRDAGRAPFREVVRDGVQADGNSLRPSLTLRQRSTPRRARRRAVIRAARRRRPFDGVLRETPQPSLTGSDHSEGRDGAAPRRSRPRAASTPRPRYFFDRTARCPARQLIKTRRGPTHQRQRYKRRPIRRHLPGGPHEGPRGLVVALRRNPKIGQFRYTTSLSKIFEGLTSL